MSSVKNGDGKLPLHVVRDNAKWVFLPTKVILALTISWPENHSKVLYWLQCFCVLSYCYFMFGNIYSATHTNSDITLLVLTLTFFVIIIEALSRYHMYMTKKAKLNKLLHIIYHEFWPSDIVGERVHKDLLVDSRRLIFIASFYTLAAFVCGLQFIGNAVFFKYLPLSTTYPYDWWKSPYYELMLCFESYFAVNIPIVVCAGDWLIVSIISVCVAQLKLLKTYVRENIEEAILNDQKFKTENAKKMLRLALNHHKKVIKLLPKMYLSQLYAGVSKFDEKKNSILFFGRSLGAYVGVCEDANDIFQNYILLQFLTSAVTVCISTFIITFLPKERLMGVTYFIGHLFEIFIYCFMGSELLHESADLSDHIFHCGWHLTDTDIDFQRSLMLGMMRSQRAIKIKAGSFGYLQLSTFLNLIMFSFSVFTLLQSVMRMQEKNI